jgi:endonuclease/exonuclease/phosphatase family metal-dependent hydrolase
MLMFGSMSRVSDSEVQFVLVRKIILIAILTILLVTTISCSKMSQNYNEPTGPVFEGTYAGEPPPFDGSLKAVTWNLKHGDKVDEAIMMLTEVEELRDADIILMQEMDEAGVEKIAQTLSYNYIFYPAIFRTRHGKLQGNAILSKYPFTQHSKVILPKFLTELMQTRIAVKGTILVEETEIDVYSVHLETVWLLPITSNTQADFLISRIDPDRPSIVGGDFNSWNDLVIKYLERQYERISLQRVSAGTGHTFETTRLRLTLDHVFSNLLGGEAGVYRGTDASDHFPLWVELELSD